MSVSRNKYNKIKKKNNCILYIIFMAVSFDSRLLKYFNLFRVAICLKNILLDRVMKKFLNMRSTCTEFFRQKILKFIVIEMTYGPDLIFIIKIKF